MKRVVSIHAARTHLSRLIDQVRAGEEVVIARGKTPVVKLVPVEAAKPVRKFGVMKGKASTTRAFFEPLSVVELAAWEGSNQK